jgi:Ca2+-binding RTX toxin-like protein
MKKLIDYLDHDNGPIMEDLLAQPAEVTDLASAPVDPDATGLESILDDVSPENGSSVDLSPATHAPQASSQVLPLTPIVGDAIALSTINGTPGNDLLLGTSGDDTIDGVGGSDTIFGLGGNDAIFGGSGGGNFIDGGAGDDVIFGARGANRGNDFLIGGDGNDRIIATGSGNTLEGDAGNDTLVSGAGNDVLNGGDGNDTLFVGGGGGINIFFGGAGNDQFFAQPGNIEMLGGDGHDVVSYDDVFNDPVTVNLLDNRLNAGAAAGNSYDSVEEFQLSHFDDTFIGADAGDTVFGGSSNDTLNGGGGNDRLFGQNDNDVLDGGAGGDVLDGGDGYDIASYLDATAAVFIQLTTSSSSWTGDAQNDVLNSIEQFDLSAFDDTFLGSDDGNHVFGFGGNDNIIGGAGNDDLDGGSGNDTLVSGIGNDTLVGGDGDDTLRAGKGADTILAGNGNDTILVNFGEAVAGDSIDGGNGFDRLTVDSQMDLSAMTVTNMEELFLTSRVHVIALSSAQLADFDAITAADGSAQDFAINAASAGTYSLAGKIITGNITLVGTSGDDTLIGSSGNDHFIGLGGADIIQAGDGDDSIFIRVGEAAPGESIDGGAGFDQLVISDPNADLSTLTITGIEEIVLGSGVSAVSLKLTGFNDVFIGAGTVFGGGGDDRLIGLSGDDHFTGGAGNDLLEAGAGNDTLLGDGVAGVAGNDLLFGNAGDDVLVGGSGDDSLWGGAGVDTLDGGDGFDYAGYGDATAGVGIDLTADSSTWTGDAHGDTLISIEAYDLTVFNDVFHGADSDEKVVARAGDDQLFGGGGNDTLVGDEGNDILSGGVGADVLSGGQGADIFKYTAVEESSGAVVNGVLQIDDITDFTQGEDKIDLSAIDANGALAGDQAFTFLDALPPSNVDVDHPAGSDDPAPITDWTGLVWSVADGNDHTMIFVSTDADADAEMQIYMPQTVTLHASDFIL